MPRKVRPILPDRKPVKDEFTRLRAPESMTDEQLAEEVEMILHHMNVLSERDNCTRKRCTGEPHPGAEYKHDPKTPAEETPLEEAQWLDSAVVVRPHIKYLSDRLAHAIRQVEAGNNYYMTVSMPPRMGKSFMTSDNNPTWIMHRHPEWKVGLISHSNDLAVGWGRNIRRRIEGQPELFGFDVAPDAGAVSNWETTKGGSVTSRSMPGQSLTGKGFKVLLIDDPVKDYKSAQSAHDRDELWNWWIANTASRLEKPYLVVIVGTRWHEDDLIGRILSDEYEGDPNDWEVISFPAIAEENDVLGRAEGDPLYSPQLDETREEALERWERIKQMVGSYNWASQYQQRPAPDEGAIFPISSLRYWTTDPDLVDDYTELVDLDVLKAGDWLDSWDTSYKGSENSDYAVGQRWVRYRANRYLIAQQRGQWDYSTALDRMKQWGLTNNDTLSPFGRFVHRRHIEETANGTALIAELRKHVSGIKGINPHMSKEARARTITPEIESGNVYLPHPRQPGFEWVEGLLSELRNFPNDRHDDQVDAMTQALSGLRDVSATISNPANSTRRIDRGYLRPSNRSSTPRIPGR